MTTFAWFVVMVCAIVVGLTVADVCQTIGTACGRACDTFERCSKDYVSVAREFVGEFRAFRRQLEKKP